MDKEKQEQKEPALPEKAYVLFSLLEKKQNITLRDDEYDFDMLLDAVRRFRDRRYRFRLIDTGRFDPFELEWITGHGADIYTSDEVRTSVHDLEFISSASKKGNAFVFYLISGKWENGEEDLSFSDLSNVARCGAYLYLTNRQQPRDIQKVARLAYQCAQSGSWLVYYHHGPLESSLLELAQNGAWIHVTDKSLEEEKNHSIVRDMVLSSRSAGSNVVLHWDGGENLVFLNDMVQAGAVVLFKSPLFDYKSPLKTLEKGIRRKRLDFRAYYLYPSVLP